MNERVAFVNGEILAESSAAISIRDTGFTYADAVFDTARTFGGKIFRLEEHVDRLMDSLRYARIDPGMTRAEIVAATGRVVTENLKVLRKGEDYWVTIRVTNGIGFTDGEVTGNQGATVVIECQPLPLRARANFFRDGIAAVIPARRRVAPEALSPNAKTTNYMNMMLAQREVSALAPGSWALMLDPEGDIAEGPGANFFVVKAGRVITPSRRYVLDGISRQVVIDICGKLGLELEEGRVPVHMAMTADEAFFTSTSLCACPVSRINGAAMPGTVPGPVTRRIMEGFAGLVDFDYVGQYLAFAGQGVVGTGL